ncbi:tungstate transport system permease protein, partial [Candidatus Hakubella thermalkaliphila]
MDLIWQGLLEAVHLLLSLDAEVFEIALLSLKVSGSAVLLSLLVGIPAGMFLALTRFPGRNFLVSLVNTGMGL